MSQHYRRCFNQNISKSQLLALFHAMISLKFSLPTRLIARWLGCELDLCSVVWCTKLSVLFREIIALQRFVNIQMNSVHFMQLRRSRRFTSRRYRWEKKNMTKIRGTLSILNNHNAFLCIFCVVEFSILCTHTADVFLLDAKTHRTWEIGYSQIKAMRMMKSIALWYLWGLSTVMPRKRANFHSNSFGILPLSIAHSVGLFKAHECFRTQTRTWSGISILRNTLRIHYT